MPRIPEPRKSEPIRRIETKSGASRYRVVLTTSPSGAPRKQTTRTFDTLPEARRFVTQTKSAIDRGQFRAPSKTTLRGLAEDWIKSRRDIRTKSVKGYESVLRPVLERLGHRPVQSITRPEVDALVDWLTTHGGRDGKGYSHRSIVYALGTLKQVCEFGVSNGVLHTNPAAHVKPPRKRKSDHKTVTPWTRAELLKFKAMADQDDYAAAFRLTLCGLRRSEVLGLSWDDVDFEAGTIHVGWSRVLVAKGKTERDDTKSAASDRTIRPDDVWSGTMALLKSLKAQQSADRLKVGPAYGRAPDSEEPSNLVLVDSLGLPVNPDAYAARFRRLCAEAKVPTIGIHKVRHSLARLMHENRVSPADGAAYLGHTLAVHLSTYVVLTERGAQAAGRALGKALA